MFDNIENIKLVNITGGPASVSRDYSKRPYNGLIYRYDGASKYSFPDMTVTLQHGEFIFIPKGESYHVTKMDDNDSRYIVFNFNGEISERPFIFRYSSAIDLKMLPKLWLMGSTSDKYRCLCVFYDLLAAVAVSNEKHDSKKADMIAPASEYLKKHIFEHDLNVEKLHRLCGISDVYFRKIFISVYGMTPRKYIIDKRLAHARSIIESGDFDNIYSVAYAVGYEDPLYFSREFKKKYGISPSTL